jgi:NADH-quinone oxidoreductase subunit N
MSFIFGSIGAIYQVKVTRLLAYSAINNAGFFILALCTQSFFGYTGGILYVVTYTIIMFGLFIFFLSIKPFGKPITLIYIHSFINLNNSLLAFSGSLLLLSLAGIPPLLGFFSKFIIFFALFDKNLFLLGFLSMLFTIFTSFYYLRLVKIFLFDSSIPIYLLPISKLSSLILGFVTIINLIFFIFPDYLLIIINNLALGLYI